MSCAVAPTRSTRALTAVGEVLRGCLPDSRPLHRGWSSACLRENLRDRRRGHRRPPSRTPDDHLLNHHRDTLSIIFSIASSITSSITCGSSSRVNHRCSPNIDSTYSRSSSQHLREYRESRNPESKTEGKIKRSHLDFVGLGIANPFSVASPLANSRDGCLTFASGRGSRRFHPAPR
jgi:hypothetical protein